MNAGATSLAGIPDENRSISRGHRTLVLRLLPMGMAVMVAVDAALGDTAEYFNATSLLRAWGSIIRGRGVGGHTFIHGQEQLGDALSMGIGSAIFVLEPALVLTALVFGGSAVARVVRGQEPNRG